jgi:hypothetical protein
VRLGTPPVLYTRRRERASVVTQMLPVSQSASAPQVAHTRRTTRPPRTVSPTMRLDGIGELKDLQTHWRLIYDRCEHTQEFAQLGLVDVGRAAAEVRRHYAECLVCRAAKRKLTWREPA